MPEPKKGASFPTLRQVSAGGVVHRKLNSRIELVVIQALPEKRWQLPKGIVDDGETPEIAALREVREEAGITAEIRRPIETIEYWYFSKKDGERVRFHKFVHFFLMEFKSGNVADHDHEVAESRWVNLDDALGMLAFKSEREIVEKAVEMINAL
jgi:8-oxo-dGTP diphosphatase